MVDEYNYEIVATTGPGVMFSHAIVSEKQMLDLILVLPSHFTLTVVCADNRACEVFHG